MKPSRIALLMVLLFWGAAAVAFAYPDQTVQLLWAVQRWMDKF
jgi:hypothetical protein